MTLGQLLSVAKHHKEVEVITMNDFDDIMSTKVYKDLYEIKDDTRVLEVDSFTSSGNKLVVSVYGKSESE